MRKIVLTTLTTLMLVSMAAVAFAAAPARRQLCPFRDRMEQLPARGGPQNHLRLALRRTSTPPGIGLLRTAARSRRCPRRRGNPPGGANSSRAPRQTPYRRCALVPAALCETPLSGGRWTELQRERRLHDGEGYPALRKLVASGGVDSRLPGRPDGRADSVFRLFHAPDKLTPENRDLTAISAWAYGYSLLFDLVSGDAAIDSNRIWAHGHSRLGKTALWAAANDLRFAGAVSNDSGCCGAAPCRRNIGETPEFITNTFPWWFRRKFDAYVKRTGELPFDQNWLLALVAPRPLLVASATEDLWADPRGEFLTARQVGEVYALFGSDGLGPNAEWPPPETPLFGDGVGYYLRTGKHDVTPVDWKFVIEFIRLNHHL